MKLTILAFFTAAVVAKGSTLSINMSNNFEAFSASNPFLDEFGANLESGDLVQLGYFELGDAPFNNGDPFDNFVPIQTVTFAVGIDGKFSDTANLVDTVDLPLTSSQQVRFGLRIFNAATEVEATRFNTVTATSWDFSFSTANPPPPASEMLLDPIFGASNPIWQDATNPFRTSLEIAPIPEASTSLSALLGLSLLVGARRRK